jgi:hypothetical protein
MRPNPSACNLSGASQEAALIVGGTVVGVIWNVELWTPLLVARRSEAAGVTSGCQRPFRGNLNNFPVA